MWFEPGPKQYERRMTPLQYTCGGANIEGMYSIKYISVTNTASRHFFENSHYGNMLF